MLTGRNKRCCITENRLCRCPQVVSGAAQCAARYPCTLQTRAYREGQNQRQQSGLLYRKQAERHASHGLHRARDQEQDDVTGEGRHLYRESALRLRPAVHQQSEITVNVF